MKGATARRAMPWSHAHANPWPACRAFHVHAHPSLPLPYAMPWHAFPLHAEAMPCRFCPPPLLTDAGTYRNKAHASGLAADANNGYSSGLGSVGAQGAGARWGCSGLVDAYPAWTARGCL